MTSRRDFLYGMLAAPLALRLRADAATGTLSNTGSNPTSAENKLPGTTNWQIAMGGYSRSDDVDLQIKGYASTASINRGEKITFYVSVWSASNSFNIDVYRVGWYGGNGGQLKWSISGVPGVTQPAPTIDTQTGMVVCPWSPSYTLDTNQQTLDGAGWTSGVYLALLTAGTYQTYIIFVVRDDARTADLMFQQSVTTYQAYNNYPDDGKLGKSLYDGASYGAKTGVGTQRAVKVSFDRPYTYTDHTGAGELLHYDIYFIRWLERNGYDVCYSTDIDTHANGARIRNFKGFLSVGHDEYWSRPMYDNVYAARDAGTSLGFFGANALYWQIRFEPSTLNAAPNRVIACYKDQTIDPFNNPSSGVYNPSLTTVEWRNALLNRPEQQLLGIMYSTYMDADLPAYAYYATNSQTSSGLLVYNGTGLTDGASVPGVLGYEFDKQMPGFKTPQDLADPISSMQVVSGTYALLGSSPFTDAYKKTDNANSSIYQVNSGAWVFASGSMYWSWGLDGYKPSPNITTYATAAPSTALQTATANILNLFLAGGTSNPIVAPSNLSETGATGNSITMSWQNNSAAAKFFIVQRSTDGVNWIQVWQSADANTITTTDAVSAGTYYYRVQASDGTNFSPWSNVLRAATQPSSPTGLTAVVSGNGGNQKVNISWKGTGTNATSYTVQRSTNNTTWTTLTSTLGAAATSYTDTTVQRSTTYYYRVGAVNTVGSNFSGSVSVKTK